MNTTSPSFDHVKQGFLLAEAQLKAEARQTKLGYVWLVAGRVVQFAFMGAVLSLVLTLRPAEYVPYLASGLITWSLFSQALGGSASSFLKNRALILGLSLDLRAYVWKAYWLSLATFALLSPLPLALSFVLDEPSWALGYLALPLVILLLTPLFIFSGTLLAFLAVRHRDAVPALQSAMALMMFLVPVIWQFDRVKGTQFEWFVAWNPFFHLLEIVRQPLLGELPPISSVGFVVVITCILAPIAKLATVRLTSRVGMWI